MQENLTNLANLIFFFVQIIIIKGFIPTLNYISYICSIENKRTKRKKESLIFSNLTSNIKKYIHTKQF